jgi:hypothetical protein
VVAHKKTLWEKTMICETCPEVAYDLCHDCRDAICEDHSLAAPGLTTLRFCADCLDKRAARLFLAKLALAQEAA